MKEVDALPVENQSEMTGPKPIPPPPILGSWRALYAAVLLTLALEVALFYIFTRSFA
jgi:hypothetical protein